MRAARALLGISAAELATLAGVGLNTVKRAEASDDWVPITAANAGLIVRVLNERGIELIEPTSASGEGVRFTFPRVQPASQT